MTPIETFPSSPTTLEPKVIATPTIERLKYAAEISLTVLSIASAIATIVASLGLFTSLIQAIATITFTNQIILFTGGLGIMLISAIALKHLRPSSETTEETTTEIK